MRRAGALLSTSVSDALHVSARVVIPEHELQWRFSRSGGAGGQHVNTSSTRVELVFDLVNTSAIGSMLKERAIERLVNQLIDGCIVVVASERRSQFQNRLVARERLADLLRAALAPPPRKRRPTRPSLSAKKERVDTKKRRGEIKKGRGRPGTDD
jgi:ribosome-associated protein